MTDLAGYSALLLAVTAMLHAMRAALPEMVRAMRSRAESGRLDSETRARIEAARVEAEADMRGRLDRCDAEHAATRAELDRRTAEYAVQIRILYDQLSALADELDELRRSMTAGHGRPI